MAGSLRALTPFLLKGKTGGLAALVNYFIGYAAVASSSSANVYAMRMNEMKTGVTVRSEATGEALGLSQAAATSGIYQTMLSRVTYCLPIFFIPAGINTLLTMAKLMPKTMGLSRVIVESACVGIGLYIAMPVNCALFPQTSRIKVSECEAEIQERAKALQLTELVYNKGL